MIVKDSVALITGGASGLGLATAKALLADGAKVVILDLPSSDGEAVAKELGENARFAAADVTDEAAVSAALDLAESMGPLRVNVNCAGIGPSARILSKKGVHDLALYAKIIQINLIGSFNVLALASEKIAATEPLEDGQRGAVVNTASIAAFEGQVGQAAYASSKGGIVGLNLPAARDLAQYGIRVNTIAPGIVETPMLATVADEFREKLAAGVPFPARLGRPTEYADLAMFLITHDYINGEVVRMDGALRMAPR